MSDRGGASPDANVGRGPIDRPLPGGGVIHEVTNIDMRAAHPEAWQTLTTQIRSLRAFRTQNADRLGAIDDYRKTMLRTLGEAGTETVHDLLPAIKEEFVDNRPFSTNPTELYDFALAADAVATSDDTDITMDALKQVSGQADSVHVSLDTVTRAQNQLCYTLVRQLKGISYRNPDDPRISEIREQLQEIQNSPFTEKLLLDRSAILFPLAAAGDEQARDALGHNPEAQLEKYQNRRFNLKTLDFEEVEIETVEYLDSLTGKRVSPADLAMQPEPESSVEEPEPPVEEPTTISEVLSSDDKRVLDDTIRRIRAEEFVHYNGEYIQPEKINAILDEAAPKIKAMGSKAIPHLIDMLSQPADTFASLRIKKDFELNPNVPNSEKGADYIATFIDGLAGVQDAPEVIRAFTLNKIRHSSNERPAETLTHTLGRITYALRLAKEEGTLPPDDRSLENMTAALIELYEHEPPRYRNFHAGEETKIEGDLLEVIALTGTERAKQFIEQEAPHVNPHVEEKCLEYVDRSRFRDISWDEFYQYDFNTNIQLAGDTRRFPATAVSEEQQQKLVEEARQGVVIPLPVFSDNTQRKAA